jgi:hypothetical protein
MSFCIPVMLVFLHPCHVRIPVMHLRANSSLHISYVSITAMHLHVTFKQRASARSRSKYRANYTSATLRLPHTSHANSSA